MTASEDLLLTTTESSALEELRSRVTKDINQTKYKDFNHSHLLYRFLKDVPLFISSSELLIRGCTVIQVEEDTDVDITYAAVNSGLEHSTTFIGEARDFDVDQAEIMMRKWFLWRKQNRIDAITQEYKPPKVLQEYFKNWLIGYDKEECAVYYLPFGTYDAKGIAMSAKYSDIEKTAVQISERDENILEKKSLKLNKRLPGFNYIFNLEGLTFANATDKKGIESFIRLSKIQQDAYPERLKNVYFINASTLFTFPFNIVKNFMASRSLLKMHVYGTDGWQEELLKFIDADQLPKFMGGTRTDPDGNPRCKTILNPGGKIDEKFYIHKTKNSLSTQPDVTKLTLSRASFSEIELRIKEPGSIIEWDFETKVRDIGFGLFYKEDEQLTELVPLQRLETSDFYETGMYKCEKAGDYVALFDNSYSWVRSKEIFYRIRIVTPSELEEQLKREG